MTLFAFNKKIWRSKTSTFCRAYGKPKITNIRNSIIMNNIDRVDGAIDMESLALPSHASMGSKTEAGKGVADPQARVKKADIDVMTIKFLINELTVEAVKDKEPEDYLLDLLGISNELLIVLEWWEEILIAPTAFPGHGLPKSTPVYPPRLAPMLPFKKMLQLESDEQERVLTQRASDLVHEIEGLRSGHYVAPPYRLDYRMISNARRRYRRLLDLAMRLGFWTDGRWDAGEEETHIV